MENEIMISEKTAIILTPDFVVAKTKSKAIVFTICFMSTIFAGIVTMLMSVYLPVTVKDLLGNVSDEKLAAIGVRAGIGHR